MLLRYCKTMTLETYLKNTLGIKLTSPKRPMCDPPSLRCLEQGNNCVMTEYNFQVIPIIIAEMKSQSIPGTTIIKEFKHLKEVVDLPVLLVLGQLDNVSIRLLVGNKVNFVVPGHLLHFPELFISLKAAGLFNDRRHAKLSIPAQLLLLYHLQKQSLASIPFKDIAGQLGLSAKTISLVGTELSYFGIAEVVSGENKTKMQRFPKRGLDLYNQIERWLQSPVQTYGYSNKTLKGLPQGTIVRSSFQYYQNGNTSSGDYCLTSEQAKEYKIRLATSMDYFVEIWKYDPRLLATDGYVDLLSHLLTHLQTVSPGNVYRGYYDSCKKLLIDKVRWAD